MYRMPLWLTIAFAVIIALLIGIIGGGIVLPEDYRLIKEDCPNCDNDLCLCPKYDEKETELWIYMQEQGFTPPLDMQKFIDEEGLVAWKGDVYFLGKEKFFEVGYVKKEDADKREKGEFCCIDIPCNLVFSYSQKICVGARWFKDGKEYRKKYDWKRA